MSCHDWNALTAHRTERAGVEPPEWRAALAHADGCPACLRAALAADPTLIFQRLAEPEAMPQASAAQDIVAMQQAVATLRRARATGAVQGPGRSSRAAWRLGIAAALSSFALLLPAAPDLLPAGRSVAAVDSAAAPGAPNAVRGGAAALPSAELVALPLVGDLNSPAARVYELGGTDLSVVMIVDETLDV